MRSQPLNLVDLDNPAVLFLAYVCLCFFKKATSGIDDKICLGNFYFRMPNDKDIITCHVVLALLFEMCLVF